MQILLRPHPAPLNQNGGGGGSQHSAFTSPPGHSDAHSSSQTTSLGVQEIETMMFTSTWLQLIIWAGTNAGMPSSVLFGDGPRVLLTQSCLCHVWLWEPFLTRRWKVGDSGKPTSCPSPSHVLSSHPPPQGRLHPVCVRWFVKYVQRTQPLPERVNSSSLEQS